MRKSCFGRSLSILLSAALIVGSGGITPMTAYAQENQEIITTIDDNQNADYEENQKNNDEVDGSEEKVNPEESNVVTEDGGLFEEDEEALEEVEELLDETLPENDPADELIETQELDIFDAAVLPLPTSPEGYVLSDLWAEEGHNIYITADEIFVAASEDAADEYKTILNVNDQGYLPLRGNVANTHGNQIIVLSQPESEVIITFMDRVKISNLTKPLIEAHGANAYVRNESYLSIMSSNKMQPIFFSDEGGCVYIDSYYVIDRFGSNGLSIDAAGCVSSGNIAFGHERRSFAYIEVYSRENIDDVAVFQNADTIEIHSDGNVYIDCQNLTSALFETDELRYSASGYSGQLYAYQGALVRANSVDNPVVSITHAAQVDDGNSYLQISGNPAVTEGAEFYTDDLEIKDYGTGNLDGLHFTARTFDLRIYENDEMISYYHYPHRDMYSIRKQVRFIDFDEVQMTCYSVGTPEKPEYTSKMKYINENSVYNNRIFYEGSDYSTVYTPECDADGNVVALSLAMRFDTINNIDSTDTTNGSGHEIAFLGIKTVEIPMDQVIASSAFEFNLNELWSTEGKNIYINDKGLAVAEILPTDPEEYTHVSTVTLEGNLTSTNGNKIYIYDVSRGLKLNFVNFSIETDEAFITSAPEELYDQYGYYSSDTSPVDVTFTGTNRFCKQDKKDDSSYYYSSPSLISGIDIYGSGSGSLELEGYVITNNRFYLENYDGSLDLLSNSKNGSCITTGAGVINVIGDITAKSANPEGKTIPVLRGTSKLTALGDFRYEALSKTQYLLECNPKDGFIKANEIEIVGGGYSAPMIALGNSSDVFVLESEGKITIGSSDEDAVKTYKMSYGALKMFAKDDITLNVERDSSNGVLFYNVAFETPGNITFNVKDKDGAFSPLINGNVHVNSKELVEEYKEEGIISDFTVNGYNMDFFANCSECEIYVTGDIDISLDKGGSKTRGSCVFLGTTCDAVFEAGGDIRFGCEATSGSGSTSMLNVRTVTAVAGGDFTALGNTPITYGSMLSIHAGGKVILEGENSSSGLAHNTDILAEGLVSLRTKNILQNSPFLFTGPLKIDTKGDILLSSHTDKHGYQSPCFTSPVNINGQNVTLDSSGMLFPSGNITAAGNIDIIGATSTGTPMFWSSLDQVELKANGNVSITNNGTSPVVLYATMDITAGGDVTLSSPNAEDVKECGAVEGITTINARNVKIESPAMIARNLIPGGFGAEEYKGPLLTIDASGQVDLISTSVSDAPIFTGFNDITADVVNINVANASVSEELALHTKNMHFLLGDEVIAAFSNEASNRDFYFVPSSAVSGSVCIDYRSKSGYSFAANEIHGFVLEEGKEFAVEYVEKEIESADEAAENENVLTYTISGKQAGVIKDRRGVCILGTGKEITVDNLDDLPISDNSDTSVLIANNLVLDSGISTNLVFDISEEMLANTNACLEITGINQSEESFGVRKLYLKDLIASGSLTKAKIDLDDLNSVMDEDETFAADEEGDTSSGNKYQYKLDIPAKNMADKYLIRFVVDASSDDLETEAADGVVEDILVEAMASRTYEFSVADYAETLLNSEAASDSLKELLKSILNYGSYAQVYFGYEATEDNLANSILPAEDRVINEVEINDGVFDRDANLASIKYVGTSLVLTGELEMRLYFKEAAGDKSSDKGTLTYMLDDVQVTPGVKGNYKYVAIKNISITDLANCHDISIVVGEEATSMKLHVNPISYIATTAGKGDALSDVVSALYNYHKAAIAYVAAEATK